MRQLKQNKLRISHSAIERSGAVMVAALVCMTLTIVLLGALLKTATTQRKQTRRETYRMQADWLAESAIERAAQRLSDDASYAGEIWTVTSKELGTRHDATIQIEVKAAEGDGPGRVVTVVAKYPSGQSQHAKRTKQVEIELVEKP